MHREFGAREYTLLVLGGLSYTCYTFIWFSLPALLSPVIDEFGLSTTEAGILVGAIPLVYVPLGIFSGLLIDRIGSRVAIGVGLVGFGIAQILRGIAEGFLGLLLPTLFLGVVGMAITFGLPKLVSELFPPERTGAMSSVYQVCSQFGPVAAFGLSRPVLEPLLGGWRPIFIASGAVVLVYSLVWAIAVWGYSRTQGAGSVIEDEYDEDDDDDDVRAFSRESARNDIARLLSHRDMLLLVLVGTMYLFISHGLRGWLAVILEGTGITPELAGLTTSLLIVAQMSGTITVPPLSDRLNRRRGALVACGCLCLVGSFGLLIGPASFVAVLVVVWITGMGLGGLAPMIKVLPIEMDGIGPALTATAVSFVYAVGEIGGFGGPFVIGALHDATGLFEAGLATFVIASVIIILGSAGMRPIE